MYLVMIISPTEKTSEVQDWGSYIPLMLKVRDLDRQLLARWLCVYARWMPNVSIAVCFVEYGGADYGRALHVPRHFPGGVAGLIAG